MKEFARWLFIKTHKNELGLIAKYCRRDMPETKDTLQGLQTRIHHTGEITGALDTLGTLNLFT